MEIYLNIFQILILIGTINGFMWSVLIFFNKNKKQANRFLALLLFLFSLGSIKIILQEQIKNFNYFLPIPLLYQFALGPLLYLYMRSSILKDHQKYTLVLLHLVPSLIFDVFATFLFFSLRWSGHVEEVGKLSFLSDILAFVSFTIYWTISLSLVRKLQNNRGKQYSWETANWASKTVIVSFFIVATWLLYIVWVIGFHSRPVAGMQPYYPIYLIFSLCIYSIGILGYYRPEIGMLAIPMIEKKMLFSEVELQHKQKMVSERIQDKHLYRNDQLNLQKLAKEMNLTVNELSYIINTGFKMNFNDLINEYRINDFKEGLSGKDNEKYTLLAIAYHAGFNSKASFYRAFKKSTGKTPSEFQRDLGR